MQEHRDSETTLWKHSFVNRAALSCYARSDRAENTLLTLIDRLIASREFALARELLIRNVVRHANRVQWWIDAMLVRDDSNFEYLSEICWVLCDCGQPVSIDPIIATLLRQLRICDQIVPLLRLVQAVTTHGTKSQLIALVEQLAGEPSYGGNPHLQDIRRIIAGAEPPVPRRIVRLPHPF